MNETREIVRLTLDIVPVCNIEIVEKLKRVLLLVLSLLILVGFISLFDTVQI